MKSLVRVLPAAAYTFNTVPICDPGGPNPHGRVERPFLFRLGTLLPDYSSCTYLTSGRRRPYQTATKYDTQKCHKWTVFHWNNTIAWSCWMRVTSVWANTMRIWIFLKYNILTTCTIKCLAYNMLLSPKHVILWMFCFQVIIKLPCLV